MLQGSLLTQLPKELPDELVTSLVSSAALRIERIVSRGHVSPPGFWYDQAEHEFVLVVQGQARIHLEGRDEVTLESGGWLCIPAHLKHRVSYTVPDVDTIWLAVFYAPESPLTATCPA
jgi:cupin 2 domain-containing protein